MKYNFTDSVRNCLASAREHALRHEHDYVGPEHMFLSLMDLGDAAVVSLLAGHGLKPGALHDEVAARLGPAREAIGRGELPYTALAKRVLEAAMAAGRPLGEVGPLQLLEGILAVPRCIPAEVLAAHGVTKETMASGPHRRAAGFSLDLDDTSDRSIYEQITTQIQERIATGRLAPGERLPSVRRLADNLDIAPGTVARAYSELERLGLVVTQGARGTRVAERPQAAVPADERATTLAGLLRPVAVAAFHLGATAVQMRAALETAMKGIFDGGGGSGR